MNDFLAEVLSKRAFIFSKLTSSQSNEQLHRSHFYEIDVKIILNNIKKERCMQINPIDESPGITKLL